MSLRGIKKQRTRKAISDIATSLFIERGYHNVTTTEIAQAAEVSPGTLFNYFPNKESLVFDDESEREKWLVDAIMSRKKGKSVVHALLEAGLTSFESIESDMDNYSKFMSFVERTPELLVYSQQMWLRHEKTLSTVVKKESETKLSELEAQAIARIILNNYQLAFSRPNPKAALRSLFKLLEQGWNG
ncbi:MAG: TetR family transcriptional regulator [Proteobacteria bacterium]|nr:MAG: TetR family transcriptional regulator [Pseudomonadota bacterium]